MTMTTKKTSDLKSLCEKEQNTMKGSRREIGKWFWVCAYVPYTHHDVKKMTPNIAAREQASSSLAHHRSSEYSKFGFKFDDDIE
jgi:hypothetical protein